ncbi:MAG: tail fiber domain-containing protein, partial [Bdellovibrio sp.]|nr:tail fiber domain-containing protein [Bdellovibrio sp.]
FSCQAIGSLDASAITAGTLDAGLIPNLDIAKITTGTLSIARGGTNSNTALSNNRVMISNGGAIVESAAITANRALASNANGLPVASAVTDTELGYLSGVTSAIQTQLNAKASSAGWANYSVIGTNNSGAMTAISGSTSGTILQHSATGPVYSTATYPSTTTANQLLFSAANNTVSGLASANNAVLMTNGSGVPAFQALTGDLFGQYALLAGRSGGQILRGGTAASNTLTLDSTADATKGNIILAPSGGNVGIGTTNPQRLLHVASSSGTSMILDNTSGGLDQKKRYINVGTFGSGSMAFGKFSDDMSGTTNHMVIDTDGKVGIGTTSPSSRLHIDADNGNEAEVVVGNQLFNSYGSRTGIQIGNNSAISELLVGQDSTHFLNMAWMYNATPNNAYAAISTSNSSLPLILQSSGGNVGIGTTAPTANLQVGDGTGNKILSVFASDTGQAGVNVGASTSNRWAMFNDVDRTFNIFSDHSGTGQGSGTAFTILPNLNVGIGTKTPAGKLDVAGSFYASTGTLMVRDQGVVSEGGEINLLGQGAYNNIAIDNLNGNVRIFSGSASADKMLQVFNAGSASTMGMYVQGYVGIGLMNPTYQLQLSTDSAAKPGTSTWTIASDERLKDIRAPFTRGLAAVNDLNTVYFNYKKDNALGLPSEKEYVGIKAQDALRAVPEAVSVDEQGYLHVTNDSIIWTAINAIKELYSKFQGQDQEITALKAEVASSRAENEQLKINQSAMKDYLCKKDPDAIFCR